MVASCREHWELLRMQVTNYLDYQDSRVMWGKGTLQPNAPGDRMKTMGAKTWENAHLKIAQWAFVILYLHFSLWQAIFPLDAYTIRPLYTK